MFQKGYNMNKKALIVFSAILVAILVLGGYLKYSNITREVDKKASAGKGIPVFMYHHFQRDVPANLKGTVITPEEFEDHLRTLKENGYTSISYYEYYQYVKGTGKIPEKAFILTIDDGYTSNYTEAFPLLKKYNTKAAISIVTSTVGKTPGAFPHFTWEQAKEMESSGLVEIYNHTLDHKTCDSMTKDELIKNATEAQTDIEKNLGKRSVKVFTYPEGKFTEESRRLIQDLGFDIQVTVAKGLVNRNTPLNDIKRINVEHGMSGKDVVSLITRLQSEIKE